MKLKHVPSDFIVNEIPIEFIYNEHGPYTILKVTKEGYRTIDVMRGMLGYFPIELPDIEVAGLKDEDGITVQFMSMKYRVSEEQCQDLNDFLRNITLEIQGYSDSPIKKGDLKGNEFVVTIRDLEKSVAKNLYKKSSFSFQFINYYDEQRFGLPGKEPFAHLIGDVLCTKDYDIAKVLYLESGNCTDEVDQSLSGIEFFKQMDWRHLRFMASAYSSFRWNRMLSERLSHFYSDNSYVSVCGLNLMTPDNVDKFIPSEYKISTYTLDENLDVIPKIKIRNTVIDTTIKCFEWLDDRYHNGKHSVKIRFTLPSGVYATMAVKQLIAKTSEL